MNTSKQAKEQMIETYRQYFLGGSYSITTTDGINSITTLTQGPAFAGPNLTPTQEKKTMYIANSDPHYSQRIHMVDRLESAFENHSHDLRKHFHMDDTDTSAWSWEHFVDAIKSGKFEYRDEKRCKEEGSFNRYNLHGYLRFRDPATPPEPKAYQAAKDKLMDANASVQDAIVVLDPKDALKKVDEFRSKTFH